MRIKRDKEFKQMITDLLESGKSVKELSVEYALDASMIRRWRRESQEKKSCIKKPQSSELEELKALRKELREVKMERDILKKAVGIFSKSDG